MNDSSSPKHARIYSALAGELARGRWRPGERLPSEAELMRRFGVSRITVSRAVRDLARADLVERRPGSGTYVKPMAAGAGAFGVLMPDLGQAEIFEPIFRAMMASPLARRHALLLGNSATSPDAPAREANAWHLCRQYLERRVSGVFFAPLEHAPDQDAANRRIATALGKAGIPLILLDRPLLPFPAPLQHDLVGIDNRRAGFIVTEHLLALGCRRLHFAGFAGAASTVDDREAGFREAHHARELPCERRALHRVQAGQVDQSAKRIIDDGADGIVCANDRLAAAMMHSLARLDCRVPRDLRLTGIDDAEYASLLPVPLTTLRQPTGAIGETALAMMLERIAQPGLPPRDVRLQCELVVRASCGAN